MIYLETTNGVELYLRRFKGAAYSWGAGFFLPTALDTLERKIRERGWAKFLWRRSVEDTSYRQHTCAAGPLPRRTMMSPSELSSGERAGK